MSYGRAAMPAMAQVNNDSATPKESGAAPTQTTSPSMAAPMATSTPRGTGGVVVGGGMPESAKQHTPRQEAAGAGGGDK